jgi:hypothetical protein
MAQNIPNHIEVRQENDNHDGNDGNDVNDGNDGNVVNDAVNVPAGAAGAATGTTNFNLRVEQNKIPEFFGSKSKIQFLALDFVLRLEDLAKMNRWTDTQTYYNFVNALRNLA